MAAAGQFDAHQAPGRDEAGQVCQVVTAVPPHSKAPCTATEVRTISITL